LKNGAEICEVQHMERERYSCANESPSHPHLIRILTRTWHAFAFDSDYHSRLQLLLTYAWYWFAFQAAQRMLAYAYILICRVWLLNRHIYCIYARFVPY